jgi:thiol-disulfide isomerase/thioredoxin
LIDILAVLVVAFALVRFVVIPRLHRAAPQPAPPVALATLGGGRFDLSQARGHTVVLDFFATWCGPCRDSIPRIQKFRREHPDVIVESIDAGEDPRIVPAFAEKFAMADVAFDQDQTVEHAFAVTGLPTFIAIDAAGRVRNRWDGDDPQIDTDLATMLATYKT